TRRSPGCWLVPSPPLFRSAVHSLKDLPADVPDGLVLGAYPEREDPRDVLVTREGGTLRDLRAGAVVGTSSPRRRAVTLSLRPDRSEEHTSELQSHLNLVCR